MKRRCVVSQGGNKAQSRYAVSSLDIVNPLASNVSRYPHKVPATGEKFGLSSGARSRSGTALLDSIKPDLEHWGIGEKGLAQYCNIN